MSRKKNHQEARKLANAALTAAAAAATKRQKAVKAAEKATIATEVAQKDPEVQAAMEAAVAKFLATHSSVRDIGRARNELWRMTSSLTPVDDSRDTLKDLGFTTHIPSWKERDDNSIIIEPYQVTELGKMLYKAFKAEHPEFCGFSEEAEIYPKEIDALLKASGSELIVFTSVETCKFFMGLGNRQEIADTLLAGNSQEVESVFYNVANTSWKTGAVLCKYAKEIGALLQAMIATSDFISDHFMTEDEARAGKDAWKQEDIPFETADEIPEEKEATTENEVDNQVEEAVSEGKKLDQIAFDLIKNNLECFKALQGAIGSLDTVLELEKFQRYM